MRLTLCIVGLLAAIGCGGPTFRNIGVGRDSIGVSTQAIDAYAARHGVTHEQAVQEMHRAHQQDRIAQHAAKYGISAQQAEAQLLFEGR